MTAQEPCDQSQDDIAVLFHAERPIVAGDCTADADQLGVVDNHRRRSQRVLMKVPVQVSGQAADGATFEESTHTLSISPHGALLVLAAPVRRGQRFILANMQTKAALECVVAHLEPAPNAPTQVGVEFSLPNPAFWRVAFPPKDWTPRHPDAKSR